MGSRSTRNIQCAYDAYSDMIGWTQNILDDVKLDWVGWDYSDLYQFIRQQCKDMDSIEFHQPDEPSTQYFVQTEFSVPAKSLAHGLQTANHMLSTGARFPIYSSVQRTVDRNLLTVNPVLYEVSAGYEDYLDTETWLAVSKLKGQQRDTRPLGVVLLRDNLTYQLALLAQRKTNAERVVSSIVESIDAMKPDHQDMHCSWSGYVDAKTPLDAVHKTLDMLTSENQNNESMCVSYQKHQRMLNIGRSAGLKVVKNRLSVV